jgi:hypothetical protein
MSRYHEDWKSGALASGKNLEENQGMKSPSGTSDHM